MKDRTHKKGAECYQWKGGISTTPEYNQALTRKRRVLKKNCEGTHTVHDWLKLKRDYDFMCLCCKQQEPQIKLTEDHIRPLSRGGTDNIENIQPLCISCNSRKYLTIINYRPMYDITKK